MKALLYKLQLCGYKNGDFLRMAHKKTSGHVNWTPRAKRVYITAVCLCVLFVGLPLLCLPWTVAVANVILSPMETVIKDKWLRRAKCKLGSGEFLGLIKIGITGSYGKTTTKNILRDILATQYKVVASRGSFNTPMGFARTVNEDLCCGTQVLIMEMGARHRGDITEMCELVQPQYGIITAIGPQHLETLGTLDNIRKTKMEIADFVPNENLVVYGRLPEMKFGTKLLGRHNQQNIALCVELARKLGISEENISTAVAGLKPTPHRLELIEGSNGVRVLDDSYNSNPDGAQIALEVLSTFQGSKVVQTCGFVEQGENAYNANFNFGVQIAGVADFVIIMGRPNRQALADGLKSAGFSAEKTFFADNINTAKTLYPQILRSGDIILIENDLPENYCL